MCKSFLNRCLLLTRKQSTLKLKLHQAEMNSILNSLLQGKAASILEMKRMSADLQKMNQLQGPLLVLTIWQRNLRKKKFASQLTCSKMITIIFYRRVYQNNQKVIESHVQPRHTSNRHFQVNLNKEVLNQLKHMAILQKRLLFSEDQHRLST